MSVRSRRTRWPRPRTLSWLAIALLPVIAGGCSTPLQSTDAPASPSRSVSPSGADLALSRLPVPRTQFCDVLPERDVAKALGGPITRTDHYGNGDEFEVRPGYRDVSHEYGCVFDGDANTTAKVWVFARPVTSREAGTLVRRERRQRDCAFPDSIRFGSPGLASVCEVPGARPSAPAVRARLEGLFHDSWLACELSEPLQRGSRVDVLQRAEEWCTGVVTTVAERP